MELVFAKIGQVEAVAARRTAMDALQQTFQPPHHRQVQSPQQIQTQAGGSARDIKMLTGEVLNLAQSHAQQGPQQLADARFVYIQSTRKDGALSKPAEIWFAVMDGAVWVGSSPDSWRAKRIRCRQDNLELGTSALEAFEENRHIATKNVATALNQHGIGSVRQGHIERAIEDSIHAIAPGGICGWQSKIDAVESQDSSEIPIPQYLRQ